MKQALRLTSILFCLSLAAAPAEAQNAGNLQAGGNTLQNNLPDSADFPYWIDMMQDPTANFFEIQRAFELYWENRPVTKGSGWKPFKRWEHYWESRVLPDGSFPAPDQTLQAYLDYYDGQLPNTAQETTTGTWSELGPFDVPVGARGTGRLNTIVFHPTDSNIIYAGAPAGGLWKSTDGGVTWTGLTDNLPTLGVSAILFNYNNPQIMYLGTGDRDAGDAPGLGVYKSTDGGVSWTVSNSGMGNRTVGEMIMHPTNPDIIIAATNSGVFKSTNAGASWSLSPAPGTNFKDLKYMPGSSTVVYASGAGEFFRSNDGGDNFVQITNGIPNSQRLAIGVTPDDPNYVYCLLSQNSEFYGLYRSTDGGLSFVLQTDTPNVLGWSVDGSDNGGQGWYDLCIAVDPSDKNTVFTGGVNIWRSTDGGVTMNLNAHWYGAQGYPTVHADQHYLTFSPVTGALYSGNDGGIHRTYNLGNDWTILSDGLAIAQVYKIGQSKQVKDLVINGYQDNGSAVYDNGVWRREIGGDGMECIIDPTDSNYMYGSIYFGSIRRSTNRGYNFNTVAADGTNGITESGAWVTPYILSHGDPGTMFAGYRNVWRSTNIKANGGITFDKISDNLAGSNNPTIRVLEQSPVDHDVLYVGRQGNTFFRSDNANATNPTWINLSPNLITNSIVRDIAAHPYDDQVVYLTQSDKVYKSTTQGWSWADITGSLPDVNMNCLVIDPYSHEGIYVGTDAGVYYRDSNMTDWVPFGAGLPAAIEVTELQIYHNPNGYGDSRLRAATYGRGLWESELYDDGLQAPMAHFSVSDTVLNQCYPDTVQLLDYSSYGATSWQWTITPGTHTYVNGTSSTTQGPMVTFDQPGFYNIKLVVSNANGSDSTIRYDVVRVSAGEALPFSEDFENFDICPGDCFDDCVLQNGWYNWINLEQDSMDWRADSAGTPSGTTGPSVDFNPGTSQGRYLYTEASWCFSNLVIMESPCIDLTYASNTKLKFANHMQGFSMGDLHVDILSNGSWVNDIMPAISGDQGSAWNVDSASLAPYQGQSVVLRFRAETGPNYSSDIAIDDVGITTGPYSEFSASDNTVCPGDPVLLTDESVNGPQTWFWTITPNTYTYISGTNATMQNPQVQFNAPGAYNISLVTTNGNGAHTNSKTAFIQVTQPSAAFTSSDADNIICDGDSISFSATPGYLIYDFQINGVTQQIGQSPDFTTSSLSTGQNVNLVVSDTNYCDMTGTPMTITVLPPPMPVLTSTATDSTICEGDSITFTETAVTANNYDFTVDGQLVQSGAQNTYTTGSLINGQMVSVSVVNNQNCEGSAPAWMITVNPIPATPVVQLVGTDSLMSTVAGDSYAWFYNGQPIGATGQVIAAIGTGDYSVVVTVDNCISDPSEDYFYQDVSVDSPFASQVLDVFPNPNSGVFTVRLGHVPADETILRITDGVGRLVKEQRVVTPAGQEWQTNLDLQQLDAGWYLLEVRSGAYREVRPVLLED